VRGRAWQRAFQLLKNLLHVVVFGKSELNSNDVQVVVVVPLYLSLTNLCCEKSLHLICGIAPAGRLDEELKFPSSIHR